MWRLVAAQNARSKWKIVLSMAHKKAAAETATAWPRWNKIQWALLACDSCVYLPEK
jgi:hypothetical protein